MSNSTSEKTLFTRLEALIASQYPSSTAPATLAQLGVPTASIAILTPSQQEPRTHIITTIPSNNTSTVFQACSISKPIAGMAIMKLVSQGKLSLDVPITNYLDAGTIDILCGDGKTRQLVEEVTIRHLMSHTSGLTIHGFPGYPSHTAIPSLPSILAGTYPANTLRVHLATFPGLTYSYSGGAITVLQLILETVTQKAFPLLMQELVLDPLKMHDSFYGSPIALQQGGNFATAHFTAERPADEPWHVQPELAAAGLWTTPRDLLRAVGAMQGSVRGASATLTGDEAFLPVELAREMLTAVKPGRGLIWKAPFEPGTVFGHAGENMPGFTCVVLGFADLKEWGSGRETDGCAVAVMTDALEGSKVYGRVVAAICYLMGWGDGTEALTGVFSPWVDGDAVVAVDWKEWMGRWEGGWVVEEEEGGPVVSFAGGKSVRLLVAAMGHAVFPEGKSIDLVPEGLRMLFRFIWQDGKRVIERWVEEIGEKVILERCKE